MKKQMLVAILAALSMNLAYAADDHKGHDHAEQNKGHAHEAKAQYGGVVSVVKDVNYELVVTPDTVALYLTDHGKPVDVSGGSATMTVLSASGKTEVKLAPTGGNKFEAKDAPTLQPGAKAVALVTLPGQAPANVKFKLN